MTIFKYFLSLMTYKILNFHKNIIIYYIEEYIINYMN